MKKPQKNPETTSPPKHYTATMKPVVHRPVRKPEEVLCDIYPELATGADVPKGPLGRIKLHFAETFISWEIFLPEEAVAKRQRGKICKDGWAIWYLFGKDNKGEYLDYYSSHRMTNDGHVRIHEDGRTEWLPAMPDFFMCSDDPQEDARLKAEYQAEVRQVEELLQAKGFGIQGDEPGGVQIRRYQQLDETED